MHNIYRNSTTKILNNLTGFFIVKFIYCIHKNILRKFRNSNYFIHNLGFFDPLWSYFCRFYPSSYTNINRSHPLKFIWNCHLHRHIEYWLFSSFNICHGIKEYLVHPPSFLIIVPNPACVSPIYIQKIHVKQVLTRPQGTKNKSNMFSIARSR